MGTPRKPRRCSADHRHSMGRRGFLSRSCFSLLGLGAGHLFSLAGACSPSPTAATGDSTGSPGQKPSTGNKALVVSRDDPGVFAKGGHDPGRVTAHVNRTLCALTDQTDPREAFRALFHPGDVVAIKLNCLAGPGLSSSVAVVDALVAGLRSIGVAFNNITIFERTTGEMMKAGFKANRYSGTGPRCMGNDELGFDDDLSFSGDVGSLFSRAVSEKTTALINVPVLKDHDLSGVGCGMKNMYGVIHNPNRYHDNNCDPYVADVCAHPHVKDKLRLTLADALTAQYHGGPARVATHQWKPGKLLASTDPVALDRIAQKIIEQQRAAHGMASLLESKRPPRWIATAAARGLGQADLTKIDLNQA